MQSIWREAAISGNVTVLNSLLDQGIDINCRDRYGQTALMLASVHGRDNAVRSLLDHSADPDVTAKYSLSALMLAIINRHLGVAIPSLPNGSETRILKVDRVPEDPEVLRPFVKVASISDVGCAGGSRYLCNP